MKLIGICGSAGAGKSTFARYLSDIFFELAQEPVRIIPFAKALKDMAINMGWNGLKDEKGRRLLQLLGTDVCRECIDQDYWINQWNKKTASYMSDDKVLVIADDVRFPNEMSRILSLGGKVYKIIGRAYNDIDNSHASEQGLIVEEQYIINNDSLMSALRVPATKIIKELISWVY